MNLLLLIYAVGAALSAGLMAVHNARMAPDDRSWRNVALATAIWPVAWALVAFLILHLGRRMRRLQEDAVALNKIGGIR